MRQSFVNRFALCCVLYVSCAWGGPASLETLLRRVETRYNGSQSLKLDFSEIYAGKGHPAQHESGVLYLKKPGRMRCEYAVPPGKLFLSDGKEVYLYTPDDHRAEKGKLKDSDDMRAPLAFLLGKLDFRREFRSVELQEEGTKTWIVALPKSANLAYTRVEFLVEPSGAIQTLRVTGQDQSKLEFAFANERLNVLVPAALFNFQPPAGVQIVETEP